MSFNNEAVNRKKEQCTKNKNVIRNNSCNLEYSIVCLFWGGGGGEREGLRGKGTGKVIHLFQTVCVSGGGGERGGGKGKGTGKVIHLFQTALKTLANKYFHFELLFSLFLCFIFYFILILIMINLVAKAVLQ